MPPQPLPRRPPPAAYSLHAPGLPPGAAGRLPLFGLVIYLLEQLQSLFDTGRVVVGGQCGWGARAFYKQQQHQQQLNPTRELYQTARASLDTVKGPLREHTAT